METAEDIIEKDEDLKATESRIVELRQKKDRSEEEEKEFKELKQHHRGRVEEQITTERERANAQAERAAKAEQALEDARSRMKELQENRDNAASSGSEEEYVTINGKKFLTDEALAARVQAGKMTQGEAWKQQKAAIREEAVAEIRGQAPKQEADRIRKDSLDYVKSQGYGWMLDDKDPKFNANDPLYKEADRLWKNGYQYDPDGPRKALEDAKRFLGKDVKREDRSEDFGVPKNNSASDSNSQKEKKIALSDIEHTNAIRFWVQGNVTNLKTGRTYTEAEALTKALEAKRKRLIK